MRRCLFQPQIPTKSNCPVRHLSLWATKSEWQGRLHLSWTWQNTFETFSIWNIVVFNALTIECFRIFNHSKIFTMDSWKIAKCPITTKVNMLTKSTNLQITNINGQWTIIQTRNSYHWIHSMDLSISRAIYKWS